MNSCAKRAKSLTLCIYGFGFETSRLRAYLFWCVGPFTVVAIASCVKVRKIGQTQTLTIKAGWNNKQRVEDFGLWFNVFAKLEFKIQG